MVKIIVEVLDILGTATKEMKQSRASELILCLRSPEADLCVQKNFSRRLPESRSWRTV